MTGRAILPALLLFFHMKVYCVVWKVIRVFSLMRVKVHKHMAQELKNGAAVVSIGVVKT